MQTGVASEHGLEPRDRRWTIAAVLGTAALIAHNWWIVIYPLGWMPSWNALISEAEATNQPHGWLLSGIDIAVGVTVLVVLWLRRPAWAGRTGIAVWWWSVSWAFFGTLEGIFPLACSPSTDKVCEDAEWKFGLAYHHYVHMGSGVIEYVAATFVAIAAWRTPSLGWLHRFGKTMSIALLVAYPFIGLTFFTHRLSTISEAAFFAMFSVINGAVIWYRPRTVPVSADSAH